jgi:hypothetical protein
MLARCSPAVVAVGVFACTGNEQASNMALRDSLGAVVARTATDDDGAYELTARNPGVYSLMAFGLGYRSTPTGRFELVEDEVTTIDIFLSPQPLGLDPLLVTAERTRTELQRQGLN